MPARVVIVQGGPASGKSTLARRLSEELGLPVLSKDGIKEYLFDTFVSPESRDVSRVLGMAAFDAQFAMAGVFIRNGLDFIIEGAFHVEFGDADFRKLQEEHGVSYAQIFCTAQPDVRMKRYNERLENGSRHRGHYDRLLVSSDGLDKESSTYGKLTIEPSIIYDTSSGDSQYDEISEIVKTFLEADNETTN